MKQKREIVYHLFGRITNEYGKIIDVWNEIVKCNCDNQEFRPVIEAFEVDWECVNCGIVIQVAVGDVRIVVSGVKYWEEKRWFDHFKKGFMKAFGSPILRMIIYVLVAFVSGNMVGRYLFD